MGFIGMHFADRISGEPVDDIDWLVEDPSANPTDACFVYLELDPLTYSAWVDTQLQMYGNSEPEAVWNKRRLRWFFSPNVDAVEAWGIITEDLAEDLGTICDGFTVERDHNFRSRGRYTDDALAAIDRVQRALENLPPLEGGGFIEAGDWMQGERPDGMTAGSADEDLEALAADLERQAAADGWMVVGMLEHLKDLRDRMRQEEEA